MAARGKPLPRPEALHTHGPRNTFLKIYKMAWDSRALWAPGLAQRAGYERSWLPGEGGPLYILCIGRGAPSRRAAS